MGQSGTSEAFPDDFLTRRPLTKGDAHWPIWVSNVGAHGHADEAGGVEFLVHVDANVPLNVMVTITVLEDIEQFVRA
jgi:hypothetical protein